MVRLGCSSTNPKEEGRGYAFIKKGSFTFIRRFHERSR